MKKSPLLIVAFSVVFIVALALGLTGGVYLDRQVLLADASVPADAHPDFKLMEAAWNKIDQVYVDRQAIQPQKMTYAAINGMVDSLGDTGHSTFLSPDMVKQEQNYIQGQFEGIGAEVQMKDGHVVIVAPIDGSPAQKAGLKPGDIILKVNGQDMTGQPISAVVNKILGPAGTDVTITIQNPATGKTRDVTITRARIEIQNVTWHMIPGTSVADLRLAGFSEGVTKDLQKALQQIQAQHATGLVLDLRNNPGGLLSEAVGVAGQFLSGGNVLLEKDAQGNIKDVPVEPGGLAPKIPMVVLINNGTASASEIVAGALQDANRATLVGETTFGTGTVLERFELSDGSALMLATQEWLTPKGRVIWHKGIPPDDSVSLSANATPLVPEIMQGMTPAKVQNSGDAQLLKALQLLTK